MTLSILHVLAPSAVGGLERVVQALAEGHTQLGLRVGVAAIVETPDPDHPFVARMRAAGVEVLLLPYPGRQYLRERRGIRQLIQERQPHVVHTHGYRADVLTGPVARALGVATATTVHGFTGGDWKNRLYERLQCRAFRGFTRVVAVARPLVERLVRSGVPRGRVRLLRNAWRSSGDLVDRQTARSVLGLNPSEFAIGWIGRLSHEKGPDVLLDSLGRLDDSNWQAAVIGDGRERVRLVEQAGRSSWAGRVRWSGMLPDAAKYLRAFDVLVLSSRTEGTPIVLFEAMAAGVPVVTTAVGGVPDVVSAAEAILVPSEDPDALATAIRDVAAAPDRATDRAELAMLRLRTEFDPSSWLDQYEQLYREIAVSRNGSSS